MRTQLLCAVVACTISAFAMPAAAVTIDYSNTPGSEISFDNTDNCVSSGDVGCFAFVPTSNNIEITSGTATGYVGTISGTFGVETITPLAGGLEKALVNGTGSLSIGGGAVGLLTATLNWVDIFTYGAVGGTNIEGSANLTNIQFFHGTGGGLASDSDLIAIASAPSGITTVSFQFTLPTSLTSLFSGNDGSTTNTSFSGSISAVPVPPAVWLFGSGLLGLIGISRRRKAA